MQKVNLFTCHFKHRNKQRQRELDFCLEKNKSNPLIDKIYLFSERPHYRDFFNQTTAYPNDINILANADIYFNDTIKYLQFIKPNQCFAITRWEEHNRKAVRFEERHVKNKNAQAKHSQDVWVFMGAVKNRLQGNFYMGIPGCDNRIAWEISNLYQIFNPCETIQCIHKHQNPERKYNIPKGSPDRIPRPWKLVNPCSITLEGIISSHINLKYRRAV